MDFVPEVLLGEVQFAEEELVVVVHVECQLAFLKQILMADGVRLFVLLVEHCILLQVDIVETVALDRQQVRKCQVELPVMVPVETAFDIFPFPHKPQSRQRVNNMLRRKVLQVIIECEQR